jgi:hypothetical protein
MDCTSFPFGIQMKRAAPRQLRSMTTTAAPQVSSFIVPLQFDAREMNRSMSFPPASELDTAVSFAKSPIPLTDGRHRPAHCSAFGQVLRDYRNYIHPEKELSHGVTVVAEDTAMFVNVFSSVAEQII